MPAIDVVRASFASEPLNAQSVFSKINFIKLETSEENIVRDFSKVLMLDDRIVSISKYPDNLIAIHNKNGVLLNRIHSNGKGPGDILGLKTAYVNDHQIEVLDQGNRKMLMYDINGMYIGESQLPYYLGELIKMNDSCQIHFIQLSKAQMNEQNKLQTHHFSVFLNDSLIYSNISIQIERGKYLNIQSDGAYKMENVLYYWVHANDTVYYFDGVELKPSVFKVLDFGRNRIDNDVLFSKKFKNIKDFMGELSANRWAILMTFRIIKDQLVFGANFCGDSYFGFSPMDSDKVMFHSSVNLCGNMPSCNWDFGSDIRVVGSTEQSFLMAISSAKFIEFGNKLINDANLRAKQSDFVNLEQLQRVMKSASKEDNPVIVEFIY